MSTKMASSSATLYLTCSCIKNQNVMPYNLLPTIKRANKKIHPSQNILKFSARNGISKFPRAAVSVAGKFRVRASSSPDNPSSSWQKWVLGFLLTVILSAVGYKRGLFANLKSKIDKSVETVEHVAEMVEEVAEEAEKLVEEVEEKLPGDSKIKQTLESFDVLAKRAVNEAKKAEDAVHKVKDVEEEIEGSFIKAAKAKAKK